MNYCPLPFRHVFIEPRGVKPCCSYTRAADMTVESWLSSQDLGMLQENILRGKIDPGCQDCISTEKKFGVSTRLSALDEYPDRVEDTKIDYIDYRSSNVCNFKCRTCEPYFSNGIAAEAKKSRLLSTLYHIPVEKIAQGQDEDWIIKNLPNLRKLMFTGGEPTMIPEVRDIITKIKEQDLSDIQILLITNGSFKDPWWIEQARCMPNLNFTVSIDAVGWAAEIIRHGTDWMQVEHNIRQLSRHAHSINFSTVVSRMNLFHLGPLLDFIQNIHDSSDLPNGRTQFIEICKHPEYLSPVTWPEGLRDQAYGYLCEIIRKHHGMENIQILENLAENIITQDYKQDLWEMGERYNFELDLIRGEDHTNLYHPSFN